MRRHETRLARLERQMLHALVQPIAAEYGIDLDELIADARRFFALTDAAQDAQLAAELAQAEAEGNAEHVRILIEGWQALKSYR
jgi:hypothetical protein